MLYINSFELWSEGKKFISKPDRFYCNKLMITGECDGIYKDGKDLVLFDLKTPTKESKTWVLQGTAYSYLAKLAGFNITRIEFIKLDKTGKEPIIYTYREDINLFLKCFEIYKIFFCDLKEDFMQNI